MLRTRPVRRRALLFVVFSLALSSCKKSDDSLPGSGVQGRKTRNVPAFKRLWVGGTLTIRVSVGKDGPLELKGDDNLLDHVSSRLENGMLKLDFDTAVHTKMPLELAVATQELEAVTAVAAARVDVQGLKARGFEAHAGGAAHITLSGVAESLVLTGNGATVLDLSRLAASSATITVEKAAHANLGYLEKLDVTASGAARVAYQGDPLIKQNVRKPARLYKQEP